MKARSCSLPFTRPTSNVPFAKDQPSPWQSLTSSNRAYELFRSVKMTPRVRTGSMVPNTGSTARGGIAFDVLIESVFFSIGVEFSFVICGVGTGFNGASSINNV